MYYRKTSNTILICATVLALAWADASGLSARQLVARGNIAFGQGKYDQALDAYQQASVDQPDNPRIYFNKAAVDYQQQDYQKAIQAFETAAIKTKDLTLEAKCRYNLGQCHFQQGQKQQDSDLNKALSNYENSIQHYQAALKLDPKLDNAAYNIEVVRLIMKDLLDKIKKQQEQADKQQQSQKQIIDKLKQLIDRQQDLSNQSKTVSTQPDRQENPDDFKQRTSKLADDQKNVRQETENLSEKMVDQPTQTQPAESPMKKAKQHVDKSIIDQALAERFLDNQQLQNAKPSQEKALEQLDQALKALSDPGQDQPSKQDQPSEQDQDQKQQQPDNQTQAPSAMARDQQARDIINEEKENQRRRRLQKPGRYRPAEKDW